jgi:plasmid stability protein
MGDSIDINVCKGACMADLLVRGIDASIVKALKARAVANGRSAEAEHRAILVRERPRRRSFAEVIAAMPDVGSDADFERVDEPARRRSRRVSP